MLAHPQQMNSWDAVPALVAAGLMGIEAFHPDNDDAASARCFELARRFGHYMYGRQRLSRTLWRAGVRGRAFYHAGRGRRCCCSFIRT